MSINQLFQRITTVITLKVALIVLFSALILGFFISFIYILSHRKEGYSGSYVITLVMLPTTIAIIILLIGNNVASAFGLVGAFSLIRYRSAPGNPRDIAYLFFGLSVGLACGMGFVGYAILFAIILGIVMFLLSVTNYGTNHRRMKLRITLPEDVDYQSLFDDLFDKYTKKHVVNKIRTTNFGSLYEVSYYVELRANINQKEFIDQIRIRNHNLNIVLSESIIDEM